MELTDSQKARYDRTIRVPEIGLKGQNRLVEGRVVVIGAGGLGSPAILYLAAAGVGTIGIVDYDTVDISNLQRQIIHTTGDIDIPKSRSASEKVSMLNPDVRVRRHNMLFDRDSAPEIIKEYDFVIDATDNFDSKFLINDICVSLGKPYSHAGVVRLGGQTMTVLPNSSACYRCVFSSPPPPDTVKQSFEVGILGAVAGTIGTIQATECIKYIAGFGTLLTDTFLTYDGLSMNFRSVPVKRRKNCAACGGG